PRSSPQARVLVAEFFADLCAHLRAELTHSRAHNAERVTFNLRLCARVDLMVPVGPRTRRSLLLRSRAYRSRHAKMIQRATDIRLRIMVMRKRTVRRTDEPCVAGLCRQNADGFSRVVD